MEMYSQLSNLYESRDDILMSCKLNLEIVETFNMLYWLQYVHISTWQLLS